MYQFRSIQGFIRKRGDPFKCLRFFIQRRYSRRASYAPAQINDSGATLVVGRIVEQNAVACILQSSSERKCCPLGIVPVPECHTTDGCVWRALAGIVGRARMSVGIRMGTTATQHS